MQGVTIRENKPRCSHEGQTLDNYNNSRWIDAPGTYTYPCTCTCTCTYTYYTYTQILSFFCFDNMTAAAPVSRGAADVLNFRRQRTGYFPALLDCLPQLYIV